MFWDKNKHAIHWRIIIFPAWNGNQLMIPRQCHTINPSFTRQNKIPYDHQPTTICPIDFQILWWWIGLQYASIHFNSHEINQKFSNESLKIPTFASSIPSFHGRIPRMRHFFRWPIGAFFAPALKHHRVPKLRSLQGHTASGFQMRSPGKRLMFTWKDD